VLQGTFDTLSLTEVLGLLAQSHKSGALWLEADTVQGRVYLAEGRCCAAEAAELTEPVGTADELAQRLVDVCFSVARLPGGSFRFVADEEPTWRAAAAVAVDGAVDRLDVLLEEWREIQAVIPSLETRPLLAAELGSDSIVIDPPRWRLLVALDGRRTVRDVVQETQRSVLDVCKALKELVEQGAVEIGPEASEPPPVPPPSTVAAAVSAFAEVAAPLAVMPDPFAGTDDEHTAPVEDEHANEPAAQDTYEDEHSAAHHEPATYQHDEHDEHDERVEHERVEAAAGDEPVADDEDTRDRGALLRLFSALRDTQ
jgi:hypothetical protein